jgi:hypothetical protein
MELHSNVKFSPAIPPAAATSDNTPWVSEILDCAGYEHNELVLLSGTLAFVAASFSVLLEEGDASDLSDAAAVADADLLGTEADAGFASNEDDTAKQLGYRGTKRYIRATVTPSGNSGDAFMAGLWAQSGARKKPV